MAAAVDTHAAQAAEIARLKGQLAQCQAHMRWQREMVSNKALTPIQKLTAIGATSEYAALAYRAGEAPPTGKEDAEPVLRMTWRQDIAERIGASDSAVGDALKVLAESGGFRTETRYVENEHSMNGVMRSVRDERTGEVRKKLMVKRLFIAPTRELLLHPEAIAPAEPSNWGGAECSHGKSRQKCPKCAHRRACPHCGSEALIERRQIICTNPDCGTVLHSEEHNVNPPILEDCAPEVPPEQTQPVPMPPVPVPRPEPVPMPSVPAPGPEPVPMPAPDPPTPIRRPLYYHQENPPDVPCDGCGRRIYAHTRPGQPTGWLCRICWPALTN